MYVILRKIISSALYEDITYNKKKIKEIHFLITINNILDINMLLNIMGIDKF